MSYKYKFTSVIFVQNSELYLKDAIDSIFDQNIVFIDNIQIILVVIDSVDNSLNIAMQYQNKYPNNILLLKKENYNFSSIISTVQKYISGDYVNFFIANDYYDSRLLKSIYNVFENNPGCEVVFAPTLLFNNHDENCLKIPKKIIHNADDYYYSNISFYSTFFSSNYLKDLISTLELNEYDEKYLMNIILLYCDNIHINENSKLFHRQSPKNFNKYSKNDYYYKINIIDSIIKKAIKKFGHVPYYLQYSLLDDFKVFMNIENLNDVFENNGEISLFFDQYYDILSNLDERVIKNHDLLPKYIKSFLIYQKNQDFTVDVYNDEVQFKTGKYLINNLKKNVFYVDIVELTAESLNFTASITTCCSPDVLSAVAIVKNNFKENFLVDGEYCEYPNSPRKTKRIFDIDWEFTHHWDFSIPINNINNFQVSFNLIYNKNEINVSFDNPIKFREYAGLSESNNYFVKHSKIVLFKGRTFYYSDYSYIKMVKLELKTFVRFLRNRYPFYLWAIIYRVLFLLSYPFMKNKKIWLFVDRDTMADDNAEYLFRFCLNKDDGIKKYFIINKSSHDYDRLKKSYSNIVDFHSFKHKFLYMHADRILSSQLPKREFNPFNFKNSDLFEGIYTFDFCFLQHGVILHDLSSWIRKYSKNLYLFVTSADQERDSIVNGYYNYAPERVQVLGLSRYDNLENDPQKEILFIPTWRRHLNSKEAIINSDYLLSINSFLNNQKLIDYAKCHGYKLVFRPHPDLWKFLDLFELNDNFRISEESYHDLFKTSSIMITDYSSVAFDFAYLKKPIIYYQRETFDEFHYDKGYFDYETMGFGSICKNENELINRIIGYIDNDCRMEDKYKVRVENFFKFNDKNNSKRIYDWLMSHML